ncbi:hypothetical protein P280DRAFT_464617 [Massarina eburnea CBS 473.64]|uniref:Uncharacterized protein n=1 Tax=Massarina eburnea CBS 473.64 TaxID=1395130 RepID=A0A6A6SJI5_9PLEO|nr:hypothetical protein P280DRAFT_464617 [Massarina eburnea CBS 473.64]
MATNIKGTGILWVTGNISKSGPLTEPEFTKWYDKDHVPEIVETSGIDNAFRSVHVDKASPYGTSGCPKPFLTFYTTKDLAFTQGDEFRKIKVKSDLLPGSQIIYDLADIDVGYYALIGKSGKASSEGLKFFLTSAIEPRPEEKDEDVNAFFDQQTATISKVQGYLHSRRFRLQYARTNAQSRVLKGLAPASNEPAPEPPTWMVVHSFYTEPTSDVREIITKDRHEVLKRAKQNQTDAYRLAKAQGKGRFFDEDEDGIPQ